MSPSRSACVRLLLSVAVLSTVFVPGRVATSAPRQNDAGSRRDAGNAFDSATKVTPRGRYDGTLDASGGDVHDYYRFVLKEGQAMSVVLMTRATSVDPVSILDPSGSPVDVGGKVCDIVLSTS